MYALSWLSPPCLSMFQTNLKTERVSPDAVVRCLRCFSVAISLIPWSVTLLIERGCLAYQLHAYAARMVKKVSL